MNPQLPTANAPPTAVFSLSSVSIQSTPGLPVILQLSGNTVVVGGLRSSITYFFNSTFLLDDAGNTTDLLTRQHPGFSPQPAVMCSATRFTALPSVSGCTHTVYAELITYGIVC